MNITSLTEILKMHQAWVQNPGNGARADLSRAVLSGVNLSGVNLSRADLSRAYLSRTNLSGADLSGAVLSGVNLSEANLSEVNLSEANLSGANLSRANLSGANLSGANLSRANLSEANLFQTIYEGRFKWEFQFQKHTAVYFGIDEIRIGCKTYPIQFWVGNFKDIGTEADYSEEQINKYGSFIRICAEDFQRSKNEV